MPRTTLAYAFYLILPPEWRYRFKVMLGSRGHRSSFLNGLKSKKDALGKRRLDRAVGNAAEALRAAGLESLQGKSVLDFGPGYIIADSLCFYLLGAREVIAADLNPIANARHLALAFAHTDWPAFKSKAFALFPDAAAGFESRHAALQKALANGFEGLAALGITYRAPFDCGAESLGRRVDVVYSTSVLEHVQPAIATKILASLYAGLNPAGAMAHVVHLEDHLNIADRPFAFLAADTDYDPERDFDGRGNRIRLDGWRRLCAEAGVPARFLNIIYRADALRPRHLAPPFDSGAPEDVFASWVTLTAAKSAGG